MSNFTPTFGAWDTTKNVLLYLKNNFATLWGVITLYLPYYIVLECASLAASIFFPEEESSVQLISLGVIQILTSWLYICFALSWHRIVIRGGHADIAHPLKPERATFSFLWFAFLIGIIPILVLIFPGAIGAILYKTIGDSGVILAIILGVACVIYLIYALTLCSVILPSIAAEDRLSFKQSFSLMKGYFWKMFGTGILTSIVLLLPYIVLALIYGALMGLSVVLAITLSESEALGLAVTSIFMLPLNAIVIPIGYAIGVTTLSNFYLHATKYKKSEV